jgi:O-antigen/teichoic acid export membrane protein
MRCGLLYFCTKIRLCVVGRTPVGCLPLILLFLLGALIGYAFWGDTGMLWGCGIGLVLGLLSAGWFVWWLRNVRKRGSSS